MQRILQRLQVNRADVASVAVAMVVAVGCSANAQSCKPVIDEMLSKSSFCGYGVRTVIVSGQANKLDTFSGRVDEAGSGWAKGPLLFPRNGQMSSVYYGLNSGQMQFSDRSNGSVSATQNFSALSGAVESIDLILAANGSSAKIQNNTWGYQITINQLTCSNGVMYGFGTPVGNANAGRPAMYVISYYYEAQIC